MSMTQLERYRATTNHQRPDALLFSLSFTPDLEVRLRDKLGLGPDDNIKDELGSFRPEVMSLKRPEDYPQADFSGYFADMEIPENSYYDKNGCLHTPCQEYHFTHYVSPLRNAKGIKDIEDYPWPDWNRYSSEHIAAGVAKAHSEGRVASVSCTHMYEDSWQVRGYEDFLMDILTQPEQAHFILERFKQRNLKTAIAAAEAGADQLVTGDDVGNQNSLMFSIEHWREFIKPRWAQVYAAAKSIKPDIKIWYHSDGNITRLIPELIEIGVDIINPLQPECVDCAEIKRLYGDRIIIDGTIGTQTTMPFGSADDVGQCVKKRVAELGSDGALIISPTHVLEPEVPLENIMALVEACHQYGKLAPS